MDPIFEYFYQNNQLNLHHIKTKKEKYYLDILQTFDNSTKFVTHHNKHGIGFEYQLEEGKNIESYNRIDTIRYDDLYGCGIILKNDILGKLDRHSLYSIEIEGMNIPDNGNHVFDILHKYSNGNIVPIMNISKKLINSPKKNIFEFIVPEDLTERSEIILVFYNNLLNDQIFSTFYLYNIRFYKEENIKSIILFQGKQGIQGEQGIAGLFGPPGNKGEKGNSGEKGDSIIGPQGLIGPPGISGDTPSHQWNNNKVRFQNTDGSWGDFNTLMNNNCQVMVNDEDNTNSGELMIIREQDAYSLYLSTSRLEEKLKLNINELDLDRKLEDYLETKPYKEKTIFQSSFNSSNILLYPQYNNTHDEGFTILKWDDNNYENNYIDYKDGIITINNNDIFYLSCEIWLKCLREDGKKTQIDFEYSLFLQKKNK